MSDFTSFVAVDSTTKTAGDHGTTVAVPVPVPDGVRYDTTVAIKRSMGVSPMSLHLKMMESYMKALLVTLCGDNPHRLRRH